MEKHAVEQLVSRALAKERRIWLSLVACMILLQVVTVFQPLSDSRSIQESTSSIHVMRRRLMGEVGDLAPSAEEVVGLAPAPETEDTRHREEVPMPFAPSPELEDIFIRDGQCKCPAGPRGPPGKPAPEFLAKVFEWDEQRNALIIKASTMDLGGHLIVNGFTGIRQSLFIGGDPSNGEAATEISPGSMLLYSKENNAPTIAGFTTSEDGYTSSSIEVQGGVVSIDTETAEATPLAGK